MLSRNWRSPIASRRGELDLVARRADTLVFCEVKARRDRMHGSAELRVDLAKQRQIKMLAQLWVIEAGIDTESMTVRFDVVAVNDNALTRFESAF